MLDIRRIRTELDLVKAAIARRGEDTAPLDEAFDVDRRQRELADQRDRLRNEIGALSKQVGQLHRDGRKDEAADLQERSRQLGENEQRIAAEADDLARRLREVLLMIPNMPADECPDGSGEDDNVVLRTHGFDAAAYGEHQRKPHWDIGTELGILDIERGAKLSGSMFVMYRGFGAALVRALIQLALDRNVDAYEEIRPPTLVKTETMISTGHLPKFADDAYHLERDDLWAIPTAEVPLTSLARDEVLDEANLPMRLMAHTSCFRREAGSAGRDTRGAALHEFDRSGDLQLHDTRPITGSPPPTSCAERAEAHRDLGLAMPIVDICAATQLRVATHLGRRGSARPADRSLAGVFVGVVVRRLPGAASQHSLSPSGAKGHAGRTHVERIRNGGAAGLGRVGRDPPPARRLDRVARRAASLPARCASLRLIRAMICCARRVVVVKD